LHDVVTKHHTDTLTYWVAAPEIKVSRAPARVKARGPVTTWFDTSKGDQTPVLTAQPFTARLDTILVRASGQRDTVAAQFDFPPPRFGLELRLAPDSCQSFHTTDSIFMPPPGIPWYDTAGKVALGGIAGALLLILVQATHH